MNCCNNCCKDFKLKWRLQRHLSRKTPCVSKAGIESSKAGIESLKAGIESLKAGIESSKAGIESSKAGIESSKAGIESSCVYCNKGFTRNVRMKEHEVVCKERHDRVRKVEIELGIEYPRGIDKHQCRYCMQRYTTASNHKRHIGVCKERKLYIKKLEKKTTNEVKVINNTLNDNRVTNNTIINCLGKENIGYITAKVVRELMRSAKSDEEGFAKVVKIIHGHRDHPENHNIVYTNLKSNVAYVKNGDEFEYKNINDVLKDVSSNTLDYIVFSENFDKLENNIKRKFENVCADDEMNKKANNLSRIELYDSYKCGKIEKP